MSEKLLRVEEVAMLTGTSTQTINNWYRWKKLNPNHALAKLLPEYSQSKERQIRYWKQSDVYDIIRFKSLIPRGRNGLMGKVTQHKKENKHD